MASYDDFVNAWTNLLQEAPNIGGTYTAPPDFSNILARCVEYVENRCYKKLVLLCERIADTSGTVTLGNRQFDLSTLSSKAPVVVESVSLIMPPGATPANGIRFTFNEQSLDTINFTWPNSTYTLAPNRTEDRGWAMLDDHNIVLKPTPDQAYVMEVVGQFQPAALSASNETNYLSKNYPDLYLNGGMVFLSGFQRDFGAQAEDPRMAMSWESLFQSSLEGAITEEQRRRGLMPKDGSSTRSMGGGRVAVPQQGQGG